MKQIALLFFIVITYTNLQAQRLYRYDDNGKTSTKELDLIDTKLDLSFNFKDQTVNGKAWIALKPHFDSTDQIQLDAKGMNIYEVKEAGTPVKYYNTKEKLNISLTKKYTKSDTIQLYIKYRGNPNKIEKVDGVAITDNKGMYFINPLGTDKDKPTQIWTQGEPEQNSTWFPTIDKPNQKTTQQITLTVPSKYKTLSNGNLISQKENNDGTRTDVWKQTLPHAPYLFFVGVGEFKVVKDSWKGKLVDYYVEPDYSLEAAKELFKNTPEMLTFFSELTGVEYPWDKYSQVIMRDFVSGAMENTGAVIHSETAMLTEGELLEENTWERVIAHELFHHWFGDLVTTESWANLTLNESFANYSEFLWEEFKYGKDAANDHLKTTRDAYLNKNRLKENYDKHLVRYNYNKVDDVLDVVSYNKGGMVLHMLRNYLGDDKFFAGLKKYLQENKFKAAEAHQLRLALEEVSGEDLLWFFSQWYYNYGHPRLKVTYQNDLLGNKIKVKVTQLEKEFDFPIQITVYKSKQKDVFDVFMNGKEKTFEFPFENEKDIKLIKVNSNHVLLAEITTPELTTEQWVYQYNNVKHFEDRIEALEQLKDKQEEKEVFETFVNALEDPYHVIQSYALENINLSDKHKKKKIIQKIERLANSENVNVAASAISILGKLVNRDYLPIFKKGIDSKSPKMKGNSLLAMYYIDKELAKKVSEKLPNDVKDVIYVPLLKMYLEDRKEEHVSFVAKYLLTGMYFIQDEKFKKDFEDAFDWVAKTNNKEAIRVMVDDFVKNGLKYKAYNFNFECIRLLREVISKQKSSSNSNKKEILSILEEGVRKLAVD
ncbi:M1 family metallopeptidase [Ochrovirga pacifica]|uniref:M1 family metallopeptidase n=1 Tax=Ochrovirga pacifica TaxID=1042376 RepID=UPI0002557BB0|nr:M1 family metallopeptidase [Ochrovirga pacifica]